MENYNEKIEIVERENKVRQEIIKVFSSPELIDTIKKFDGKVFDKRFLTALRKVDDRFWGRYESFYSGDRMDITFYSREKDYIRDDLESYKLYNWEVFAKGEKIDAKKILEVFNRCIERLKISIEKSIYVLENLEALKQKQKEIQALIKDFNKSVGDDTLKKYFDLDLRTY